MTVWTVENEKSLQLAAGSVRLSTKCLTDDIVDIIRRSIQDDLPVVETVKKVLEFIAVRDTEK